MTTVVIGDIGGHHQVLESILTQLGVSSSGQLPEGLQVLQVGDLVRADPLFRDQNTRILNRMRQVLEANPPDAWVQLIGNHESAALGGPSKSDWNVSEAFEHECLETLQSLWTAGRLMLASTIDQTLVTHAGLTRARWMQLGAPSNAKEAAHAINVHAGSPIGSFCKPGSLVTGEITHDADVMWAEVNFELLLPWVQSADMPFDQIHGHAAPFPLERELVVARNP